MRVLLGAGIGEVLPIAIRASSKVKSRLLAKVRLGMTNLQEGPLMTGNPC